MKLTTVQLTRTATIAFVAVAVLLVPFNVPLFWHAPEQDSFFTLTPLGSAVLALLSLVFLSFVFWLLELKSSWLIAWLDGWNGLGRAWIITLDIFLGWLIYLLLHRLSPQLYYLYYMTLFDGLPLKWVIGAEYDLQRFSAIVLPGPKERLADFLACTGFWAVLSFTLLLHRADPPKT